MRGDETRDLHNEGSGREGWDHSRNFAGVDKRQEIQSSKANARGCEGEARVEEVGLVSATRHEKENLLEGSRTTEKEEALKQTGRAGA